MGTPQFGANVLEELNRLHEVVLVITQPDKLVGRKREIQFSPVKELALKYNLPIFQPQNIRNEEAEVYKYDFDIIVTAAFGQFVGTRLLNYPKYKAINVHGSLLPKYRGGAPIQRAIINGEQETGITIMYMAKKMDAGDILSQAKLAISDEDTADTIFDRLSHLGAKQVLEVIDKLEKGDINPIKQDESLATYSYNLTKEDEKIDFSKSAKSINQQIRGLCSNPGAYFTIDDLIYKVYSSEVSNTTTSFEPGTIIEISKKSFTIACGDTSAITFYEIKPEGRNVMKVSEFLNGKGRNIIIKNRRVV
jgi:methionyl-tRNA formyltransferase